MINYSEFKLHKSTQFDDQFVLIYNQHGWGCNYSNLPSVVNILSASGGWNIHIFPTSIGEHICNLDSLFKTNPEYFI